MWPTDIYTHVYAHVYTHVYTHAYTQVQLLLTGKTLLPNEPYLHILFEHMYLRPVPIGLTERAPPFFSPFFFFVITPSVTAARGPVPTPSGVPPLGALRKNEKEGTRARSEGVVQTIDLPCCSVVNAAYDIDVGPIQQASPHPPEKRRP